MATVAHKVSDKQRTNDVLISENISFEGLLLSDKVLNGLKNTGFIKPSPIQLKAIPLGRCGLDLIVQAKSGTGKTCVFSVIALESICTESASTQVLVLAPTREIAVQIWEVIKGIGSAIKGLECHTFIGGLPLHEDRIKLKKCHIAVGSPGRIKQLIETAALRTENIRMFILDEADKLLEEGFQDQINWIYSTLPENKQMLALSATYPEYLADHLTAYMRNPTFLRLNISDPALLGIRQYYQSVQYHPLSHVVFEEKCKVLIHLLSSISFQQCLVFSNVQTRASNLADTLTNKGWPTACIAGCLDQKDRNHAMAKLKTYKCRILISTDLTARGIDADKVNLVINMDIPKDHETYLHRIGRAGRFGSFGIAVSLVSDGQEKMKMNSIEKRCNTTIHPLPDPLPVDLAKAMEPVYLNDMVTSEVINTDSRDLNCIQTQKRVTGTNMDTLKTLELNDKVQIFDTDRVQKNGLDREDDTFHDRNIEDNKFVQHLSNGHFKTDDLTQKENGKEGLTLYDLNDGPRNGLHFAGISALDTKHDTIPYHESSNPIRMTGAPDMNINNNKHTGQSLKNGLQTPNITATKRTFDKSCLMPNKTADTDLIKETSQADCEVPKIYSPKSLPATDSIETCLNTIPEAYKIPKCTTVNLSQLFQQHIGYQKRTKALNYSSAKQSLKEFREKFSGYTEKSELSPPQQAVNMDDQDLLKTAVSQLQELFDRNMSVKVEPDNLRHKTEKVTVKEITQPVYLDEGLKLSERQKDTEDLKTIVEPKGNKTCLFDSTDRDNMDVVLQESSAIKSSSFNKDKTEESSERNSKEDDKPKQTRTRKHYTNRFAVAHLLQEVNSVFDKSEDIKHMTEANENLTDIKQHQHEIQEDQLLTNDQTQSDGWSRGNYISRSVVTEPKIKIETDQSNSSERPQGMNSYQNGAVNSSRTLLLNTVDSSNPPTRESSENRKFDMKNKRFSHQQASKDTLRNLNTNQTDEFSSDSDSDSDSTSESNSSDSSDEDTGNFDHKYDSRYNPYEQRFNQDRTNWQFPFPISANLHERQSERTLPVGYNRGHFGSQPPGFQYLHGYPQPHPTYYNPWWNSYGNNFGLNRQEYTQHDMKAAMEKCYDDQRRYIKAMSKVVPGNEKKGSKKKSKNKR